MHLLYNTRPCLRPPTLVGFQWLMGSLLDWRISGWFTCSVLPAVLPNHFAAFPHLVPAASSAPLPQPHPRAALLAEELAVLLQVSSQEKMWVEKFHPEVFHSSSHWLFPSCLAFILVSPMPTRGLLKRSKKKENLKKKKEEKIGSKSPNLAAVMAAHAEQWVSVVLRVLPALTRPTSQLQS